MQQRLASGSADAQTAHAKPGATGPQVILGIDPSLRGTGYGVIDTAQATPAKAPSAAPPIGRSPAA